MSDQTLIPRLNCLRDIFPPSHITLIGAGNGGSVWAQWLMQNDLPALLLEADPAQYRLIEQRLANQPDRQHRAAHALVAPEKGDTHFYTNSLAAESGLLPAENLSSLWPNLHTVQKHALAAVTLHDTLVQHGIHTDNTHLWLFIDCLPAAPLLASAGAFLSQADVVIARVVLPQAANHTHIDGTGLNDLDPLLHGMQQIALQPTRHPAIAHALFVRDYRAALYRQTQSAFAAQTGMQQQLDASVQSQHALDAALVQQREATQALQTKLETETRIKTDLQHKLDEATQAAAHTQQELQALLTQKRQTVQTLHGKLNAETQAKTELQRRLEQALQTQGRLETALAAKTKTTKDLQSTFDAQMQAKAELQTELEEQIRAKIELQHELEQLTRKIKELQP